MLAALNDYARWSDPSLKIPHMGWNTLKLAREHALFEGIPTGDAGLNAYFVHSYHLVPARADLKATVPAKGVEFLVRIRTRKCAFATHTDYLDSYSGSAGMAFSGGGSHGLIPEIPRL